MAGEQAESLPEDLREWVASRAAATDRDENEVLGRAVMAYRLVEEGDVPELVPPDRVADLEGTLVGLEGTVEDVETDLESVEADLEGLESDLEEKIADVRQRVVQVLQEVESRAPADHDHPGLADDLEEATDDLDRLTTDLEGLETRVDDALEEHDEALANLTDTTDELEEKLYTLASVVVTLKSRTAELAGSIATREAVAELKASANRQGVTAAECDGCGRSVNLALLSTPQCPHCDSPFDDLEPSSGFFGSPTLTIGTRPALEGETGTVESASEVLDADDE